MIMKNIFQVKNVFLTLVIRIVKRRNFLHVLLFLFHKWCLISLFIHLSLFWSLKSMFMYFSYVLLL